ncbi:GTPase HflX [Sulfobacillus acidophilus]|uniref:GTPase HflX n=1 Tax=Sulfobacillus acidophilus TaxID=53633 RepID=A0ABS3AVZ4_9FIRM|nr:GTPase HflX [Sulfobacillus acidophilus]
MGLKSSQIKQLERLYRRKIAPKSVISSQLVKDLCTAAFELGRIVGLLVNRRGSVENVILGDATRLYLPDIGRIRASSQRLRGLRLIVAKPKKKQRLKAKSNMVFRPSLYEIDHDFIVDLEKLRLDLVLQIQAHVEAESKKASLAIIADKGTKVEYFRDVNNISFDFSQFIAELEAKITSQIKKAHKIALIKGERGAAILIGVYLKTQKAWKYSLNELKELCVAAKVTVVDTEVQRRLKLDAKTVVGQGKLEDICLSALHKGAQTIIFDCDLSPSQLNSITDLTDLKVLDRTMLILDIFAKRAVSRAGKLQVELAQLKYSLPRLAKKQTGLSRLTGGIGGQGPGETKLEVDRRRAKDKVAKIEGEIETLKRQRRLRSSKRHEKKIPTIAIVGYTNAGKSTLLNALTNSKVLAKNELFATLDPTARRLRFPKEHEVILTDTVGFIRDLPKGLINAFRATLEELKDADLLLHVVDATDQQYVKHSKIVEDLLGDLKLLEQKRVIALNKCDLVDSEIAHKKAKMLGGTCISAKSRSGFKDLMAMCSQALWPKDIFR